MGLGDTISTGNDEDVVALGLDTSGFCDVNNSLRLGFLSIERSEGEEKVGLDESDVIKAYEAGDDDRNVNQSKECEYGDLDIKGSEEADGNSNVSVEKDLESFINEFRDLNKDKPVIENLIIGKLKDKYFATIEAYNHDSKIFPTGKNISEWEKIDINNWARVLKENNSSCASDIVRSVDIDTRIEESSTMNTRLAPSDEVCNVKSWGYSEFFPEMLAVIKRANILATGNDPRMAQILSVFTILCHEENQGRLIQVSTGEGKSTTSAMLAVMLGLCNEPVDIATSSSLLAERDAIERKEFYEMFNLTVSHNISNEQTLVDSVEFAYKEGRATPMSTRLAKTDNVGEFKSIDYKKPKKCYLANIVYGDLSSFQADMLRDEYMGYGTRNGRAYKNIIIDEVDSMFIDDISKIVRLSSPISSMEYLESILVTGWRILNLLIKHLVYIKEHNSYYYIAGEYKYSDGKLELLANKDSFSIAPSFGIDTSSEEFSTISNRRGGSDEVFNVKSLDYISNPITDSITFEIEYLKEYFKHLVEQDNIVIPKYLKEFALLQVKNWAESAVTAIHMELNKDYIIKNKDGRDVIVPVDYHSTGIVQDSTIWQNGLHQFLQLKHGKKLSSESFTTSFISSMGYVLKYGFNIFGMTGTFGSKDSQDLLTSIYPIDLAIIPTYKPKQFTAITDILAEGRQEWLEAIYKSAFEQTNKGRSVLIICPTIYDVEEVSDYFNKTGFDGNKIKKYSRNDTDEVGAINDYMGSGEVIIATNLAGRGTDIKTSKEVELAGGMHVIMSSLPDNLRVEQQGFGRTARQGNLGTGHMIIDKCSLAKYGDDVLDIDDIDVIKKYRDHLEHEKLEKAKTTLKKKLQRSDRLFSDFTRFTNELRSQEKDEYKLRQLDELWGLSFKRIDDAIKEKEEKGCSEEEITNYAFGELESFKNQMRGEYFKEYSIYKNPSLLVRAGINKLGSNNNYHESIAMFDYAASLDDAYSFAAIYNRAYAKISQGYKDSMQKAAACSQWQQSAAEDLISAKIRIEENILPQLASMLLIANQKPDSELFKQIMGKITIFKEITKYIDNVLKAINNSDGRNVAKISRPHLLRELFSPDDGSREEIGEISSFGIMQVFEVETIDIEISMWDGVLVGVLAFAQFVIGTICVGAGMHSVGVSLISSGIQDMFKVAAIMEGHLTLENYFVGKGIEAAVNLLVLGIGKIAAKAGIGHMPAAPPQLVSGTPAFITQEIVQRAVVQTAVAIGLDYAGSGFAKLATREFKDDIEDSVGNKMDALFSDANFRANLEYILLIDKVTQTNRGQRAINEAIRDTLKSMQTQRSIMIDQTITALRHSNNNVVSGIAGVVRLGKFGHDISKVNDFAEDFCESFGNKISYIKSQLPTLTQILQKELNLGNNFSNSAKQPVSNVVGVLIDSASCSPIGEGCGASSNVVSVDAGALMNLLEQNNIITGTKVDSDYKNKLVSSKFAEYRKHVMPINRFLHKISVGSSSNDAAIGGLHEDLAKIVSKSLMSEIRHHIANPIAHEGVHQSGLIGKITDKIEIGISNLREALKSLENTEGSIIIDLNSDEYSAVSHPKVDGKKLKHHPNSIEEAAGQRVISAVKREQEDLIGKYLTSEAGSKIPQFNSVTELIEVNPPTSGPNALINELLETSPIRNILVANNINYDTTLGINNSITTTMGIGFSLFEEANAGANVTPVRANVSLPMIEAMAIKYGPKVAKGFIKMAPKLALRTIPGVGAAIIATDVYDLYQHMMNSEVSYITYERRAESREITTRKNEVKDLIEVSAVSEAKKLGTCEYLKLLPVDQLVQEFVDIADQVVPEVIEQNLPVLWERDNVIGILKHSALKHINKAHQVRCDDDRLKSETPWRDKDDLYKIIPQGERLPGWIKGAIRLDLETNTDKHPELPNIVYDAKFGKEGISKRELDRFLQHAEDGATIKEVRPTNRGGIRTLHFGNKE